MIAPLDENGLAAAKVAWTGDARLGLYPEQEAALSKAIRAYLDACPSSPVEGVAWACTTCNSPRSVDPCPKCGTALTKPADGWEWPGLPDIDRIRELAREVGYAIGVHGSLERDLDLIAAPWVAEAVSPLELAEHIAHGLGGNVVDFERQDKPCGRWACNIHTPDWNKMIDLSVMPPATPERPVIWMEFNNKDGFTGLRRWTRDPEQAARWEADPDAGRFEEYFASPSSALELSDHLAAQRRLNKARSDNLRALAQGEEWWAGVRIQPMASAPSGADAPEPYEIETHEGAWAVILDTNAKPLGWFDAHSAFTARRYPAAALSQVPK